MKKLLHFFMIFIIFTGMHVSSAMEGDDSSAELALKDIDIENGAIESILQQESPERFAALAQQLANKPTRKIYRAKYGQHRKRRDPLTPEKELALLETSMLQIEQLNDGVLAQLDDLSKQAVTRCNRERKKGCGKGFLWGFTTAALFAGEVVLLAYDITNEGKLSGSLAILSTAYVTGKEFLTHTKKTFKNNHIEDKIHEHLKKIKNLETIKNNLVQDIERTKKKIEEEKGNGGSLPTKSSKKSKKSKK